MAQIDQSKSFSKTKRRKQRMNSAKPESATRDLLEVGVWSGIRNLTICFAIVSALVIGLAAVFGNGSVVLAALLSAVVCFMGAVAGHFLAAYPRGDVYLAARLYASMAARMGLPFVLLFICKVRFDELFSQGMVYFVILFYLVGMIVDLTIRMRLLRTAQSTATSTPLASTAKLDS